MAGVAQESTVSSSPQERNISITLESDSVEIIGGICINANGTKLREIYRSSKIVRQIIDGAVLKSLGGARDDQEIQNVNPEYLQVLVQCSTDERFVDILKDYDFGRMKNRLREEFSNIGFEVKGLVINIENIEEVNANKIKILKRC